VQVQERLAGNEGRFLKTRSHNFRRSSPRPQTFKRTLSFRGPGGKQPERGPTQLPRSVQEEVPDAGGLDPGDVGGGAGEHAGLVLHRAANGPEAHHPVHLPAVPAQLAEERPARVALEEKEKEKCE